MEVNKKEYHFLSNNTTIVLNRFQQKLELMQRLLENYVNFNESSYLKLKVILMCLITLGFIRVI